MADDRMTRMIRYMTWEKIRGMLKALMHTFWEDDRSYDKVNPLVEEFIKKMDAQFH